MTGALRPGDRLSGLMRAARGLAVAIADADGRLVEWGDGAASMLGYDADEAVGRHDLTLGHDPVELAEYARLVGAPDGLAALLRAAEAQEDAREWTFVRRDGGRIVVARSLSPIVDEAGATVGYAGLARDVTRRRRAEEEQDAVRRVAMFVAGEPEPHEVFARVAEEAGRLIGGQAAGIVRFDGSRGAQAGTWAADRADRAEVGAPVPLEGPGAVAQVHRTGRSARVHDLHAVGDPLVLAAAWGRLPPVRSVVASPVRVRGRLWGALWAGSLTPGALDEGDEARLTRLGDLTGLAVANAEAREDVVNETLATIFRGDLDLETTIERVVATARQASLADRATCYVHTPSGDRVQSVHTTEVDPRRRAYLERARGLTRSQMPVWQLLSQQEAPTMVVEDVATDPAIPPEVAKRLGAGALVGLRLEHRSIQRGGVPELLGTLFLSFRTPRLFTRQERTAMESLAAMVSVALANARLHAETLESAARAQETSRRDPLTGLPNHRSFQERLSEEVARARRHRRSLALALIDIDRFRRVNERFGHECGDRVLVTISALLQSAARDGDMIARIGGEEIAWLMPETEAMEAWQAVDRAREMVARTSIGEVGAVTVSAGVCDLDQAGSAGELHRLAEGALYWAKQHGRDVAFLYSPKVVEELSAQERADRLQRLQALQSIRVLARAVDAKDTTTREHSERVAELAVAIGTALGWEGEALVRLREAGLVHDVGKIGVPDRILFKPGRLTHQEYEEIKQHAQIGAEMVVDVLTPEQVDWVRGHHERWDGSGYPRGLAGDRIPLGARILALADSWDVMTSVRPYHDPLSTDEALAECRRCVGAQFSEEVVDALESLVRAGSVSVS
jgi:diguanylate cyclase (GGDEF)-like protein/PAS domain S-box-containing protein